MQQSATTSSPGGTFLSNFGPTTQAMDSRNTTELAFKLSRDSEARVILRGVATQEAIEKLSKLLELQKDTFPTQAELSDSPAQVQSESESGKPE